MIDEQNIPRVQLGKGLFKVSRPGNDVATAQGKDMLFNSDFSFVRENIVPLLAGRQAIVGDKGYGSSINVGSVKIDFSDWVDFDMYLSMVVDQSTSLGTFAVRLFNVDLNQSVDGSELVYRGLTEQYLQVGPIDKPNDGIDILRAQSSIFSSALDASYSVLLYNVSLVFRSKLAQQ